MPTLSPIDVSLQSTRMHTFADGGNLWSFGHVQTNPFRPCVFKSTDGGNTWIEQDSSHATRHADNGGSGPVATSGGIHYYYDATNKKIWFSYYNIQTFPNWNVEFQQFDINTGLYSAVFGFGGPNLSDIQAGPLQDFVVLSDGSVIQWVNSILNTSPAQLTWRLNAWLYSGGLSGSWTGPINFATNQVDGIVGNDTRADMLGAGPGGTTAYAFYQVAQDHHGTTGIPTYAIYYRSIDNTGSLGSITTVLGDTPYLGSIATERYGSLSGIPGFIPGLDPHDGHQGVWRKTWLSFQNVYVDGTSIKTAIVHNGKPAALWGTPLSTPTFTTTDIASPTGLEEVTSYHLSGTTDIAAWVNQTTNPNDTIQDATNTGSGWGASALLYANASHTFNYIWPVGGNASFEDYLLNIPYYIVTSGPVAPTCSLSSVVAGGSVTLTWTTANSPTSASIDNGIGSVNPAGGSVVIPLPTVTTTYTLTVTNAAGMSTCQTTVTITPPVVTGVPGVLEFVAFGGNGAFPGVAAGFGNVYTTPALANGAPVLLTDDDYGQIFPYYTTYFFVNHEQEMALQLGAHRKMLTYFTSLINGTGNITIQSLCNVLTNIWPLSVTRALAVQAIFDLEWAGGSATAQRMAFKFASSPATGTDNGFQLEKCVATLKPVAHLPIRGSST